MTTLKEISHAIELQMQLRDFGHVIDDENGGSTFETTAETIEALGAACDRAARAALLALAECDIDEAMINTSGDSDDLEQYAEDRFRAICRALAEEGKDAAK